jgi:hypothetical protein
MYKPPEITLVDFFNQIGFTLISYESFKHLNTKNNYYVKLEFLIYDTDGESLIQSTYISNTQTSLHQSYNLKYLNHKSILNSLKS